MSTTGHYLPKNADKMEKIGVGKNAYFETSVFLCDGDDRDGNPNVLDWMEEDSRRYATGVDAEKGHRETCLIVAGLKK